MLGAFLPLPRDVTGDSNSKSSLRSHSVAMSGCLPPVKTTMMYHDMTDTKSRSVALMTHYSILPQAAM